MPVEVQALTIAASGPNPRLIVNGVDAARVAMVLAVLDPVAQHVTIVNAGHLPPLLRRGPGAVEPRARR